MKSSFILTFVTVAFINAQAKVKLFGQASFETNVNIMQDVLSERVFGDVVKGEPLHAGEQVSMDKDQNPVI
jgi:hypothetical protein